MSSSNGNISTSHINSSSRINIVEKLLFQNVLRNQDLSLDESQLKKINTIVSNLPYQFIKSSYEKIIYKQYLKNKKKSIEASTNLTKYVVASNENENRDLDLKATETPVKTASAATSSTSSSTFSGSNLITIHVNDEIKNIKRDFTCPKDLLLSEMKYFNQSIKLSSSESSSLLNKRNLDDIDISVHCDINIFDWLMRYVKRNHPHLIDIHQLTSETEYDEEKASAADNVSKASVQTSASNFTPIEPKLDLTSCISILLSSDFLVIQDLVDKCILFIASNLETMLAHTAASGSSSIAFGGLNDNLLSKLAACVPIQKLNMLSDRKDKIKTKLYQKKIEFIFDVKKYKEIFDNSLILNEWVHNRYKCQGNLEKTVGSELLVTDEDNYINFLYECENDASTLFKCKLCSRLMTKQQSLNLKCQMSILSARGEYIYLHVPDNSLDFVDLVTRLMMILKEKLKSNWHYVYWYLWALIKNFKCKKCDEWFRLIDMDRCRININTHCSIHDSKFNVETLTSGVSSNNSSTYSSKACSCIYSEHQLDAQSAQTFFSKSPMLKEPSATESPESRMKKFTQFILDHFDKKRSMLIGKLEEANEKIVPVNITEHIENAFKSEIKKTNTTSSMSLPQSVASNKKLASSSSSSMESDSYFIDSITGRHIALVKKSLLALIRLSQLLTSEQQQQILQANTLPTNTVVLSNEANFLTMNLDLISYMKLINRIDNMTNVLNYLEVLPFLKIENKQKWDMNKPTRLNQDNQRENDLKRFREISNYLIKAKLLDEHLKKPDQRSPLASLLIYSLNNSNTNNSSNSSNSGGYYCRIEVEWKQRIII